MFEECLGYPPRELFQHMYHTEEGVLQFMRGMHSFAGDTHTHTHTHTDTHTHSSRHAYTQDNMRGSCVCVLWAVCGVWAQLCLHVPY